MTEAAPSPPGRVHLPSRLVVIGASAGGLDALERLFAALQPDADAAFVVIQHLSADHKSMMDSLLARHTSLPVVVARHDMPLAAAHVFLIPPGKTMTLADGKLKLAPKPPNQLVLPIDVFMRSAASELRERVIAVVLSGTGSDGSRGSAAIKEAGGYLIAQNPDTARFDGMPRSVIGTGLVDVVLDVEQIGPHVTMQLARPPAEPVVGDDGRTANLLETDAEPMAELLHLLHGASGLVFRDYKPTTLNRRVLRRMHMQGCETLERYLAFVHDRPDEIKALKRDLLIPVTMFFRDPEAFEVLMAQAVSVVARAAEASRPVRVWVAGCATGEEAYSVAMLFDEAFSAAHRWPAFKLFATDAEEQCLATAGAGIYPRGIASELDEGRLARYFESREETYAIRKEVRQNLVFARHNVIEDPPFTQVDLVCCRNLLIYLQPEAQERVLRRFQYALRPGGFLFLGSSETLGSLARDFDVVDARARVYRLKHGRSSALMGSSAAPLRARGAAASDAGTRRIAPTADLTHASMARDRLFARHVPPTLLLGDRLELIDVFGDVRHLLAFRPGGVSLDAPGLLPQSVAPIVKMLVHRVAKSLEPARVDGVALEADGIGPRYDIVVQPLARELGAWPMLASFEPGGTLGGADAETPVSLGQEAQVRIDALEQDLANTRDNLQATIEELETSNEELQATNEELMATNEELQSTNEELQSVNEELFAVNAENTERIDLLNRANVDLDTLSRATRLPTVFLDGELRLTRFTQEATQLFGFRDTDLGRPLTEFSNALDHPELFDDIRNAIRNGLESTREVKALGDRWYQVRVLPCANTTTAATRVVATFLEITSLRDVHLLQAVVDSLPEQVAVLNVAGEIQLVNSAWRAFALENGGAPGQHAAIGCNYLTVCEASSIDTHARLALDGLRAVLDGRLPEFSLRYPCHSPVRERWFLMHVRPLSRPGGGVVVSHVDTTQLEAATTASTPQDRI